MKWQDWVINHFLPYTLYLLSVIESHFAFSQQAVISSCELRSGYFIFAENNFIFVIEKVSVFCEVRT
jgi:hypothetical protein